MRKILLLLAILSPLAWADTTQSSLWTCSLDASLRGDSNFFLRYGRDSWKGKAVMNCRSENKSVRKEVEITFNGAQTGYGVSESSVIAMSTEIVTSNLPSRFQVYAYVFNKNTPSIVWRNESGGILIEANVISDDIPAIQASLQQGNLYIR